METTLTVRQIQDLIVNHAGGPRANIFIPNLSWGYFKSHEADLIKITKDGYMTEYEIKRSWEDFLADFKKTGTHFEGKVSRLYYVVPESIHEKCWNFIINHEFPTPYNGKYSKEYPVGLMYYSEPGYIRTYKSAPHLARFTNSNDCDYKLYLEEQIAIMRLGLLRLWMKNGK